MPLSRDDNFIPVIGGVSSLTDTTPRNFQYDPTTRGMTVHIVGDDLGLSTSAKQDTIIAKLAKYETSDIDEATSTITYIGKMDADGVWLVQKIDESTNPTAFTYATIKNNVTLTTYALGWAGRATNTYGTYQEAF